MSTSNFRWVGSHVECEPPKHPKKITGTRFASILGSNVWSTPFQMWCEITKTYEKPFEDTIYTIAGKTIEPKQADYIEETYFMNNLIRPEDKFGKDYFKKTFGSFFGDSILNGMWDYILTDFKGNPKTVIECKTTKRIEDWQDGVPKYYGLQASLYAHLLGLEDVMMVCTVLEDKDYEKPEEFEVTSDNTFTVRFKVHEEYPDFDNLVEKALSWWKTYVETGVSPDYDENADKEYLDGMRKRVMPPSELESLIQREQELSKKINDVLSSIEDEQTELKAVKDAIKNKMMEQFQDGDKKVVVSDGKYEYTTSRSSTTKYDTKKMIKDGMDLDKYKSVSEVYKLTIKEIE